MFVRPPQQNSSTVASTIITALQMCPSRLCRIDMQQAGGAVGMKQCISFVIWSSSSLLKSKHHSCKTPSSSYHHAT